MYADDRACRLLLQGVTMGYCEDIDSEEHPRNAAAIRTALMLGAEFQCGESVFGDPVWSIKGIDSIHRNRTMPAWLYLVTQGIGITHDARACLLKDIQEENSK